MSATTVGERFFAPSMRGESTMTFAAPSSSRKRRVSARFSSSSQLTWRNSTSISSSPTCSRAQREVVERAILEDDVRRELEEDAAELAGRAQRLERLQEAAEDLAAELARGPLDAAAVVGRRVVAQIRRERLQLDRMARHEAERLDVHDEVVRRPLRPAADHFLGREAVVSGVDLDGVEVLRVVGEPLTGGRPARVPVLRERLVGPRARADPDLRHASQHTRRGPCRAPSQKWCDSALRAGL